MNAAERFLAASRARDVDRALAELAPDVVMLNPSSDDPVVGREHVATTLRAVEAACDYFEHTHLLSGTGAGASSVFGLVFIARVGGQNLSGVDLLELDGQDRIARFTVMARPLPVLMALGARMASNARTAGGAE